MDPNANLREQREIRARWRDDAAWTGDADRLAELTEALDEWISRGGVVPAVWTPQPPPLSWQAQQAADVERAVSGLSRLANVNTAPQLFVDRMAREHRTLQQGMFGLFLAWAAQLAGLTGAQYDARNAASVAAARKVVAAVDGVTRLPLI